MHLQEVSDFPSVIQRGTRGFVWSDESPCNEGIRSNQACSKRGILRSRNSNARVTAQDDGF